MYAICARIYSSATEHPHQGATLELFCSMSTFIVGGNLDVTIFNDDDYQEEPGYFASTK